MLDFIRGNLFLFLVLFLCICAPSLLFGAMQVIAIVLLSLLVLGVVGLLVFRWRVSSLLRDLEDQQRGGGAGSGAGSRSASDPTLHTPRSGRGVNKDVGDYVDFEDLES